MKQYLMSVYSPEGGTPAADVLARIMSDVDSLNQELKATGTWVFAGGLHPSSTATVVRLNDGDMLVTDGPFVEGKEHIGGRPRSSNVYSARSMVARLPSWFASLATSTSPRKLSRTPSPRRSNGGRPPGFRPAPPAGSSPPPATGRSTASAGSRRATTGTRRQRCCTPAMSRQTSGLSRVW